MNPEDELNTFDRIRAFAAAKKAREAAAVPKLVAVPSIPENEDDSPYGLAALREECEKVASATEGTRNAVLNTSALKIGRLVGAGELREETALDNLAAAAARTGLDQAEIALVLRSNVNGALTVGKANPRVRGIRPVATVSSIDDWSPPPGHPEFWEARPELAHIAAFARARRACPWAVLGVVLARVVVAVPSWVVLPPLVGTSASLNTFIALVSGSGGGKGASESAATDAVDVGRIDSAGVGSGEGLAHLFMRKEKRGGVVQHREAVLMKVTEIDTLAALGDRRGATLLPELRKAWSGEDLGFAYADPTKALPLPAHRYRLALVAGVQPGRAQWVLDDADGGTPQRFLWLPAQDPGAPDLAPACPDRWTWTRPDFGVADYFTSRVTMPVVETARRVIDEARLARLRGDGEALDGHALLARLKAAAALGLLAGRGEVTEEDWQLSGALGALSDATRTGVVEHLRRDASKRNRGRAEAEAERAITVRDRQEEDAVKKACAYVLRKLRGAPDGLIGAELSRGTTGARRMILPVALEKLAETGEIVSSEVGGNGTQGLRWNVRK